jgi:hypothetical protein
MSRVFLPHQAVEMLPSMEVTMSKKLTGLCLVLLALSVLPGCVAYPAYGPGYYGPPRGYGPGYYQRPRHHDGWGYYRR